MKGVQINEAHRAFAADLQEQMTLAVHRHRGIPPMQIVAVLAHMAGYAVAILPLRAQQVGRDTAIDNLDAAILRYAEPPVVFHPPMAAPERAQG